MGGMKATPRAAGELSREDIRKASMAAAAYRGTTIIRASNDAASELEIQLTGIKTLSADDFYL
jgi:hypothetical protein